MAAPDRRLFLKYLGAGLTGVAASGLGPIAQARGAMPFAAAPPSGLSFTPIEPSLTDALVLPQEFESQVLALWGDRLPGTNTRFGYNADFTALLPLPSKKDEGLLWVNHEYVSIPDPEDGEFGVYTQTFPLVIGRSPTIDDEMADIGASVLHVRHDASGRWQVLASPLTRRYDVTSPMAASGPALPPKSDSSPT